MIREQVDIRLQRESVYMVTKGVVEVRIQEGWAWAAVG